MANTGTNPWLVGARGLGSSAEGGGFVPGEGDVVVVASSVGELEEGLDVVSLVRSGHAVLISLGDDGAECVPLFPCNVRGGELGTGPG